MRLIPTALAITVGLFTLLDFFFDHPLLNNVGATFREWAIILTAFALLLGLGNLLFVHFLRVTRRNEPGTGYSAIVLVVTLGVFAVGLWYTLPSSEMAWLFNHVYLPLQGAFFALTAFFLATAAYRALRARNLETTLMVIAAVIVLIGQIPLAGMLADAREWILRVPSEAGLRGIMLGVALGTLATALRLIIGMDRPYSE
ncbi:MAG: hypothetical protein HZC40_10960 [Chloroflexi bacterium]|nr:hypothetical protein [Chloroflexota bacterium]